MPLVLQSFRDYPNQYVLDPNTGAWSEQRGREDHGTVGLCGFKDVRLVGLRSQPLFVAVYTDGRDALLRIAEDTYNLGDPHVRVVRSGFASIAKTFKVLRAGTPALTLRYWWADIHEWPDDDVLDIFLYVPTHVATNTRRFVRFGSLVSEGKTAEVVARLLESAGSA